MEIEVECPNGHKFESEQDVGKKDECPICHKKFMWDFDVDDEADAVLIPNWE